MSGAWVLVVVLLSAFGPYVAPGIRTEQLIVYGSAALLLVGALTKRLPAESIILVFMWGILATVVIAGTVQRPLNTTGWKDGDVLAGLDNVLLPLAVMIVVIALVRPSTAVGTLQILAKATAFLMMVNVGAALMTVITGYAWTRWWSSGEASTAARALTQSRVSGLINQPAEAGILYGAAIICALYLWASRPTRLAVPLTVLLIGGTLTVSKVFFAIVIPVMVWHLARSKGRAAGRRIAMLGVGVLGLWGGIQSGLFRAWQGSEQLARVLSPTTGASFLQQATANRFGETSTVGPVIKGTLDSSPLSGFGAGGLDIAYDNAWVEQLVTGGLLAVILFTLVLGVIARVWRVSPRTPERTLLGSLLLLVSGAAVGVPSLTANRVATVIWVLLMTTVLTVAVQRGWTTSNLERRGRVSKS